MAKRLRPGNRERRKVCIVVMTFWPDIMDINFFLHAFSMLRPIFFIYLHGRNLVQMLLLNLRRMLFLFPVHHPLLQELLDQQLMTPMPYF